MSKGALWCSAECHIMLLLQDLSKSILNHAAVDENILCISLKLPQIAQYKPIEN